MLKPKYRVSFKIAKLALNKGFYKKPGFMTPYFNHLGEYRGNTSLQLKAYLDFKKNLINEEEYKKYDLIYAPTYEELNEWLRNKHKININILTNDFKNWHINIQINTQTLGSYKLYKSYAKAFENALSISLKEIK